MHLRDDIAVTFIAYQLAWLLKSKYGEQVCAYEAADVTLNYMQSMQNDDLQSGLPESRLISMWEGGDDVCVWGCGSRGEGGEGMV